MKKTLIIIPTYNEADNIKGIISKVINLNVPDLAILVVDDNSPDETGKIVAKISAKDSRIRLIQREGKLGLGTAYVAGFKYAIKEKFDYVFEIDADFSHDPDEIPKFLEKAESYDLIIGSRYIAGVNVVNWPLSRLLLSLGANWYTRIITGLPVYDCTGGYRCFRRAVLESIDLDEIHSDGYSFQIEMTFKVWKKNFRILELPIVFTDRVKGNSKMTRKIMREAAWVVWKLRFLSLVGKIN
ncbi:MAG: polyprenol monophosphomannose synthase [Caldithrix sp.]|nr:MAG: polyprenol monophosphomannose synthase [Caldithrix sp.]TDI96442.1 MAG: polyprenol monophosphomannose synthase [Caldithrix sp.]